MKKQTSKFKETEIGMIPEDWEVKTVNDICSKITSGGTPSRTRKEYWEGGTISWLKTQELNDGKIHNAEEKITKLGLDNSSAKILPINTVLMAMYGATVGKLGVLKIEATTNQAFCAMIVDQKKADYEFLFYFLLNSRNKIIGLATGAAQQNLNQDMIKNIKLSYPFLSEQSAIAKILSDLDSKIELNQQMNRILESIGQAIFKRWFVDFEFPNNRGKPYKSSGGKMVDSELGEIPEGWRISKIEDEFVTMLGGTPSTQNENYWKDGKIPWINSGEINKFRITEPTALITEEAVNNSATKLMPKGTTVLAITGATLGQVSRIEISTCANQSVIGIIENENIPSEYIYFWVKHKIADLVAQKTGGAQQHINKNNVNEMKIMLPNTTWIMKFNEIVRPIFTRISNNCFEIHNLSAVRDSLLPKLMSGKIRVPVEVKV